MLAEMAVQGLIGDARDAAAVQAAIARVRPDAVINELTSLPRHYTPAEMRAAAPRDSGVAISGADSVYYSTRLRGASNEKARHELNFRPRPLEWLQT